MDRRAFLRTTGYSGLAVALTGALAGCRTGDADGVGTSTEAAQLPTFQAADVATPDLVGAHEDSLPGFFAYPATPATMYADPVVSGVSMTALTYSFSPVVPALSENEMWQNINDSIGAQIDIIYTPQADYASRFATTIAGGDIPDMVAINPPVQQLPAMLESTFADLSEFLSGDAILEYPSLANIPTSAWRKTMVQGRIWGLPIPRAPIGPAFFVRRDILDERGLPTAPADFGEFTEILREVTDPQTNAYGSASLLDFPAYVAATLGLDNGWANDGGAFTYWMETEEYEQALVSTRELVDEGLFHPDSISSQNTQRNEWFTNGSVPTIIAGWGGWHSFVNWGKDIDGFAVDGMLPFGYEASIEPSHGRSLSGGFTALRAAPAERIEELLRIADWLAAPYGTTDYLTRKFGIEGQTYDLEGTDPVSNERGTDLRLVPFAYLTDCLGPIYQPNDEEVVRARFDYQEVAIEMMGPEGNAGLYSDTESARGAQLETLLSDARTDILAGRAPVSTWADAVASWRSEGGDAIRSEYETAAQEEMA
ncbi:extracellular solute-binding protein [Pseudactinotalea sp.]|uniref:extracellular solute-binding protein n=1 Tax=Pseudactinotalea sp. TaxID=1926260 RepID=UPI003B3A6F38